MSALVEAHVVGGYDVAADMLTRTSEASDFAPDVSVFARARDAATGGRKLEEIVFEILGTQRLGAAATKARALAERGVRRIFAIDVRNKRALLWAPRTGTWEILPPDGVIADPLFVTPLPIAALVGAAQSDDAVAAALLAKQNPVLARESKRSHAEGREEGRVEGLEEGRVEGLAQALLVLLEARGFALSATLRSHVLATTDARTLERWLRRAVTAKGVKSVFAGKTSAKKS